MRLALRQEINRLGEVMIRLEMRSNRELRRQHWDLVGELNSRREMVCDERSALMRSLWFREHDRRAARAP